MKILSKKKGLFITLLAMLICSVLILTMNTTYSANAAESVAKKYYADYDTFAEVIAAGTEMNQALANEGFVLLKNVNNALPMRTPVSSSAVSARPKVSVFGIRSLNTQVGGGGSGNISGTPRHIQDALSASGYEQNPTLLAEYEKVASNSRTNEVAVTIPQAAQSSFASYRDAAILMFARTGAEGSDLARRNLATNADKLKHYLELTDNELALVDYVKTQNFGKIIVVLNSSNAMEVPALEDDAEIDAIISIGHPGLEGILALGRILNGQVNPSGRLVDVYGADFTTDPTWFNFGDNSQNNYTVSGTGAYTFTQKNTIINKDTGAASLYRTLDYEEGIYMGYRWYETAFAEEYFDAQTAAKAPGNAGYSDTYYNRTNGVVYPFGFGMSYTSFEWTTTATNQTLSNKDGEISIPVTVKNTGAMAGKDVVQIYYTPPYANANGLEMAEINMVEFAKSKLLQPGESQTLTIKFDIRDMASFDYLGRGNASHTGYELIPGGYIVSLRTDSHNVKKSGDTDNLLKITYTVPAGGFNYDVDPETEYKSVPLFSGNNKYNTLRTTNVTPDKALVFTTRADFVGTFPTAPVDADITFTAAEVARLASEATYYAYQDTSSDPWYVTNVPTGWKQATAAEVTARVAGKTAIQLWDMSGLAQDDAKWDTFMNQLTWSEMVDLISSSSYNTPALYAIGKRRAIDNDGPGQLGSNSGSYARGTGWVSHVVISQTYNTELAYKQGVIIGNESLFLNINGWYGPGANTHRSPFGGRNFEYYSQDGVQGGIMCAAVVGGATSKGVNVYLKHYALNDQETNRNTNGGVCTWFTEQAGREIYFKTYELAIKRGGCTGLMNAFNRIGGVSTANYNFMQEMTVKEWGFTGVVVTDFYAGGAAGWPGNMLARTNTVPLGAYGTTSGRRIEGAYDETNNRILVPANATEYTAGPNSVTTSTLNSPTQWFNVRATAQRLLYVAANGNLMRNGVDTSDYNEYSVGSTSSSSGTLLATVGRGESVDVTVKDDNLKNEWYTVLGGSLPDGLYLTNEGVIEGTVSASAISGTYSFSVAPRAKNYAAGEEYIIGLTNGGVTADGPITAYAYRYFRIIVSDTAAGVSPTFTYPESSASSRIALADGYIGVTYAGSVAVASVQNASTEVNITYKLITGQSLPSGLTLSPNGLISGVPTEAVSDKTFGVLVTAGSLSTGLYGSTTMYMSLTIGESSTESVEKAQADAEAAQAAADAAQADAEAAQTAADAAKTAADAAKAAADAAKAAADAKIAELEEKIAALEEGGCNSTVEFASIGIAIAVIIAGAFVILSVKKKA